MLPDKSVKRDGFALYPAPRIMSGKPKLGKKMIERINHRQCQRSTGRRRTTPSRLMMRAWILDIIIDEILAKDAAQSW